MKIADTLATFMSDVNQPYGRNRSWNHCYNYFHSWRSSQDNALVNDTASLDYAALHLFAYLASWGMLRKSPLMQVDYKALIPVVKVLTAQEYDFLWHFDIELGWQKGANLLFDKSEGLITRLHHCVYETIGFHPTDTLVSKMILGTQASIVAYDSVLREGVGREGLTKKMGERSYSQLARYYHKHRAEFEEAQQTLHINYPPYKLIDMHFWTLGNAFGKTKHP